MHTKKCAVLVFVFIFSTLTTTICLAQDSKVPFEEYADAFAKAAGLQDLKRDDKALIPVLKESYVAVKLGVFDVWHPRTLFRDKNTVKKFKTAAGALLDLQERWIEWTADEKIHKQYAKEIKTLNKWVNSWKLSKIPTRSPEEEDRPDLLKLLEAKDDIVTASNNFETLMLEAKYLNREEKPGKNVLLILAPNRGNFIEMACFVGSLSDYNRGYLWRDSMATWTTFDCEAIQAIAMEYPATTPGNGDITQGVDMNVTSKTGLLQHVTWNAAGYLILHYHAGNLPRELINGFALNMVIDSFKEITVRSGGGSAGKKLAGYSVFVPGGNSAGGTLPGRKIAPTESRWRKDRGKDYFRGVLQKAQKQGAKNAAKEKTGWNKLACFPLQSDSGVMDYTARAPFFTEAKDRNPIPAEYMKDFKEFFRAYQCAFAYWIRNKARKVDSKLSSEELLKQFLGSSAKDGKTPPTDKIYGLPLSSDDDTIESLEWQFLKWIAKG